MNSYANVGCASVLLGGAGLVLAGGGLEMLQNGSPFGWLAVLAGLGLWLLLAFLFWITHRANRRRAWINRQPFPHYAEQSLPRGGFWRAFLWTWAGVVVAHTMTCLIGSAADLLPYSEQVRAVLAILSLGTAPAYILLPTLVALVYSAIKSTALE